MARNINVDSPVWNFHYYRKQNSAILEDIIEQFGLLVNNKLGRAT